MKNPPKPIGYRLRQLGLYLLTIAMALFVLDTVWVVFFGGVKIHAGDFVFRSTTLEFPMIALTVSIFGFLLLKGKWKESLLLVGSLFIVCVLGEGMLRMVNHPWSKPFIDANAWQHPSDEVGFTLVPNFEGRGPMDIWIKTNAEGFRESGDHSFTKSPGETRILGLGDSFAFGWGVSMEETFLKKLEERLQRLTGLQMETINSGIPGWDLNHYYVYYREIGVKYSPDIVLLSYFFNDAPEFFQETLPPDERYQKGGTHTGGLLRFSYLFNFVKSFAHNIRVKNRYKRFDYMNELGARRKKMAEPNRNLVHDPGPELTRESTDRIKTLLQKTHALAQEHGSQLIIMYIPDVAQIGYPEWQHINRILASLTTEMKIPFLDMTPVFESTSDPLAYYLWPKDAHSNARGHEKMAEALTPLVCQALQKQNIHCADPGKLAHIPPKP